MENLFDYTMCVSLFVLTLIYIELRQRRSFLDFPPQTENGVVANTERKTAIANKKSKTNRDCEQSVFYHVKIVNIDKRRIRSNTSPGNPERK